MLSADDTADPQVAATDQAVFRRSAPGRACWRRRISTGVRDCKLSPFYVNMLKVGTIPGKARARLRLWTSKGIRSAGDGVHR